MVVPLSSILKQNPQYLTQFLIKPSCLLLWHCINLASLSQGKINVHDKLEGGEENKGNLIQNTGLTAEIQAA
jgi:hypothetical protein